jgi:hypothetical protein
MVEEPLPCPFCGEEPNEQEIDGPYAEQKMTRFFCDWGMGHAVFIGGATRSEAIAAWNTRTEVKA